MPSKFSDIFSALVQAGGVDDTGSLRNVTLIRNGEKIKVIDTNGNEIEIKFKKLESYLQRGYKRVE